jgi:hypothetical protein
VREGRAKAPGLVAAYSTPVPAVGKFHALSSGGLKVAKVNPIQLQKALKGVKYPANKKDLAQAADQNQADDNIRAMLKKLPDEQYGRPSDVSKAIGQLE